MAELATKKRKEWEFREGKESSRSFAAFALYRDMGAGRSLGKVAEGGICSAPLLERWCRTHNWVKRAQAYDAYLDERQRHFTEQARIKRALRHAGLGRLMQRVAKKKLRSKKFRERIAPREVVALVRTGVDVEREALGDSAREGSRGTTVNVNVLGGIESAISGAKESIVRELLSIAGPQNVQALPAE